VAFVTIGLVRGKIRFSRATPRGRHRGQPGGAKQTKVGTTTSTIIADHSEGLDQGRFSGADIKDALNSDTGLVKLRRRSK